MKNKSIGLAGTKSFKYFKINDSFIEARVIQILDEFIEVEFSHVGKTEKCKIEKIKLLLRIDEKPLQINSTINIKKIINDSSFYYREVYNYNLGEQIKLEFIEEKVEYNNKTIMVFSDNNGRIIKEKKNHMWNLNINNNYNFTIKKINENGYPYLHYKYQFDPYEYKPGQEIKIKVIHEEIQNNYNKDQKDRLIRIVEDHKGRRIFSVGNKWEITENRKSNVGSYINFKISEIRKDNSPIITPIIPNPDIIKFEDLGIKKQYINEILSSESNAESIISSSTLEQYNKQDANWIFSFSKLIKVRITVFLTNKSFIKAQELIEIFIIVNKIIIKSKFLKYFEKDKIVTTKLYCNKSLQFAYNYKKVLQTINSLEPDKNVISLIAKLLNNDLDTIFETNLDDLHLFKNLMKLNDDIFSINGQELIAIVNNNSIKKKIKEMINSNQLSNNYLNKNYIIELVTDRLSNTEKFWNSFILSFLFDRKRIYRSKVFMNSQSLDYNQYVNNRDLRHLLFLQSLDYKKEQMNNNLPNALYEEAIAHKYRAYLKTSFDEAKINIEDASRCLNIEIPLTNYMNEKKIKNWVKSKNYELGSLFEFAGLKTIDYKEKMVFFENAEFHFSQANHARSYINVLLANFFELMEFVSNSENDQDYINKAKEIVKNYDNESVIINEGKDNINNITNSHLNTNSKKIERADQLNKEKIIISYLPPIAKSIYNMIFTVSLIGNDDRESLDFLFHRANTPARLDTFIIDRQNFSKIVMSYNLTYKLLKNSEIILNTIKEYILKGEADLQKIIETENYNPIIETILMEEDSNLEFKGSWSLDLNKLMHTNKIECKESIRYSVVKNIAGMLNGEGGKIVIGILEESRFLLNTMQEWLKENNSVFLGNKIIVGIEKELEVTDKSIDDHILKIQTKIRNLISDDSIPFIKINSENVQDKNIYIINVKSFPKENGVWMKKDDKYVFYLRENNETVELKPQDAITYLNNR
jgi:hypothetical protein